MRPIPENVKTSIGKNLYLKDSHPIKLMIEKIVSSIELFETKLLYHDDPVVSFDENFTNVLIDKTHTSTGESDTFYIDNSTVLRTHMTAHQVDIIKKISDENLFGELILCAGDVYRRDSVDATHYPVFHQLEGVCIFPPGMYNPREAEAILKELLVQIVQNLFGKDVKYRFASDNFPFVYNGIEIEVLFNNKWVEVLGSGVIQHKILMDASASLTYCCGIAFGMGIERLAMILCNIPDIRYFWTEDPRFIEQFKDGLTEFVPYSTMPPVVRDISMWIHASDNFVFETIRSCNPEVIENVKVIDRFFSEAKNMSSKTFRITYRHPSKTLHSNEVNALNDSVVNSLMKEFNAQLR